MTASTVSFDVEDFDVAYLQASLGENFEDLLG